MINPVHFLFLIGGSFFGTLGFIAAFWIAGVVRTNLIWFISILTMSVTSEPVNISPVNAEVNETIVVNHRSSSVRTSPAIKLQGTLSGALPVRPVSKIYSAADRARTAASIRVCRVDSTPEMIDVESFSGRIAVVELRYEPSVVQVSLVNPETIPTSTIFGP